MEPEFYVKKQPNTLATTKCLTHYTLNIASPQVWDSITVIETFGKECQKSLYMEKGKVTSKFPKMATGGKTNMFLPIALGSLGNDDGDGDQNRKKSNRFRLAKQQLCTCITLFCTFLCCCCTTKPWKCLILHFVEDRTTRQGLSFPKTLIRSLEFNSRKICKHLTNWMSWN